MYLCMPMDSWQGEPPREWFAWAFSERHFLMSTVSSRSSDSRPPRVIRRESAEHYRWGEGCDGWHLVRVPALSVIAEEMPAGTSEVEHHHEIARQFFYVLEGETVMVVEGREFVVAAGDGIEIAPGQRHRILNRSDRPASFLVVSQPPSQGDRLLAPGAIVPTGDPAPPPKGTP